MIGLVLSGGGNRCAQQVGALQVLLEHGVKPDILIGTSAGGLNAAYLASSPTSAGARQLARLWEQLTQDDVYPGSFMKVLQRLGRGEESLYPNTQLHHLVQARLRELHLAKFGDIRTGVQLYVVATQLETGDARIFGDERNDSLLDALMATTALPPLHTPWPEGDIRYVDGMLVAQLPIRMAIARGAHEIYALHVTRASGQPQDPSGLGDITTSMVDIFVDRQAQDELDAARRSRGTTLHYIPLTAGMELPFRDLSHAPMLIQAGRTAMETYLCESQ